MKQHLWTGFLIYKVEAVYECWWDSTCRLLFYSIVLQKELIPKPPKHGPASLALLVMGLRSVHKGVFNLRLISASVALSMCNVIESSGWASSQVWIKAAACAETEWDNHFQWAPIARSFSLSSPLPLPHVEWRGFNGMNVCWFPSEIKK